MPIDKIQNLKDMEYYANMEVCSSLVKKWRKLKPNNKELKSFEENLLEIAIYVVGLFRDNHFHKVAMSDYKEKWNKVQLELQDLKKKYDKLERDYKKDFETT